MMPPGIALALDRAPCGPRTAALAFSAWCRYVSRAVFRHDGKRTALLCLLQDSEPQRHNGSVGGIVRAACVPGEGQDGQRQHRSGRDSRERAPIAVMHLGTHGSGGDHIERVAWAAKGHVGNAGMRDELRESVAAGSHVVASPGEGPVRGGGSCAWVEKWHAEDSTGPRTASEGGACS